jgi:uncharacterized protein (DUF2384 family)
VSDTDQPLPPGRFTSGFRTSRANATRLPRDQARRQGNIATLAFLLLGGRDRAMDFLNTLDETLGARPIDLAIASDDGYSKVETAIKSIAQPASQERVGRPA